MSIPLRKQALVQAHITEIIAFLRREGHDDIRLLCHDHRDIPFAASFADVDFVYLDDIYTYLALLNSCALNITYRVHSALPCLSFGRPVISISYDERALSLFRTVGYADWNIDMIQTPDVVAAVKDRYQRLNELEGRRAKTHAIWTQLDNVMSETFRAFAAEVRVYHDQNA
jgi:polysaccharide pyruvyl transferase WcaK-like protein